MLEAVGSLVVMELGPGSIQGATKDSQSACGVRARKIHGSESQMVGS